MTIPTIETLIKYGTVIFAVLGAIVTGFYVATIIWAFRDMRLRSRDPFAQILAGILVAAIPFVGVLLYMILRPPETLAERYERALEEEALLQEIEVRPRCPKCSRTVEPDWVMCANCHTELKKQCVACYSLIDTTWSRCPFCSATQPAKRPALDPKRLMIVRPHLARLSAESENIDIQQERESVTYRRRYRSVQVNAEPNELPPSQAPQVTRRFVVGTDHPTVTPEPAAQIEPPEETRRSAAVPIEGEVISEAPVDKTSQPTVPIAPIRANGNGQVASTEEDATNA